MEQSSEKPSDSSVKKKVDESWKEAVQKEKQTQSSSARPGSTPADAAPPNGGSEASQAEPLFPEFLSSMGMQVLAALGELEDPALGAAEPDLKQARYLIDILQMISRKTRGNLTPEEGTLLENLLYELQMKYVQKTRQQHA